MASSNEDNRVNIRERCKKKEKKLTSFSFMYVCVAEAPTRAEFLQKRLISAFFGFQWQNLAEILRLFKKYNYLTKIAVKE